MGARLLVTPITVGAFAENCYLVSTPSGDAAIVDPGAEPQRIIAAVRGAGVTPRAVWITHGHVDHIGAIASIVREWQVPVFLHPLDMPLYRLGSRQAEIYGIPFEEPPAPDQELSEGMQLALADLSFDVMHAPGHAPGHVVIHGHGVALVGDCLFAGSIGRTDLPYSSPADLAASLDRIAALDPETVVYPGHGPTTTIRDERESNPFLTGAARILGLG